MFDSACVLFGLDWTKSVFWIFVLEVCFSWAVWV